jgi:transposase-like protein
MKKFTLPPVKNPSENPARSVLEEVLRDGAKRLLQEAIEYEVLEYVQKFKEMKDEMDNRLVTRNGYLPARDIQTGIGPINVRQPRVRDKRDGEAFSSIVLPKYKRKTESLERLIPELYLRGISTNNFPEALSALLGKNAVGLSPANITRMKEVWEQEYEILSKVVFRPLSVPFDFPF